MRVKPEVSVNNKHMGYYIETTRSNNKARWILDNCPGSHLANLGELPPKGMVPVIVVDNGFFEAAGIAFDQDELDVFTDPYDGRPRTQLFVPRAEVIKQQPTVEQELSWP